MRNKGFSVSIAKKISRMLDGEALASSALPQWMADELKQEGLLGVTANGSRKVYRTIDADACVRYVKNRYTGGADVAQWIALAEREGGDRGMLVRGVGDSKAIRLRTFHGFLVNCCEPIEATMGECGFALSPVEGTAVFIQCPEKFRVPADVVIVGVENGENFSHIRRQRHLFAADKVLFVSRYPQSADLRDWLMGIPNPYIHFGDFDLAGIQIYLSEFYSRLGDRASFFIPDDIEERLRNGNSALYDRQYARYKDMVVTDCRLLPLVQKIHLYRKVYEQEGFC